MGSVTGSDKPRAYLACMGIATPWWVDAPPAAPAAPAADDGHAPAAAAAPRRTRRLADALDAAPATPVPVAAPAAAPAVRPQPVPTGTVRPFTLLAWGGEGGVLLLDIADGQLAACPPERQQLAQDLWQAFSGKPARLSPQCLCWPPRGRNQPVSLAEARDMAQGCIRRENERAALGEVILLGDTLPQWLGIATGDALLSSHFLPSLDARCLCLRGWPDGLDAAAKRTLWRTLAALGSRT